MDNKIFERPVHEICMSEIMEVCRKYGCFLGVQMILSSFEKTEFKVVAIEDKKIVLANAVPKMEARSN